MSNCLKCNDTGILCTGRSSIPCTCLLGDTALFTVPGVEGQVSGKTVKKHFIKGCPEPIRIDPNVKLFSSFFQDENKMKTDGTHHPSPSSYLKINGLRIPLEGCIVQTNLTPNGVNSTEVSNPVMVIRREDYADQDHTDLGNGNSVERGYPLR